jgi:hypothetical protein
MRDLSGQELSLPSWNRTVAGGLARQAGEPDADQCLDVEISPRDALEGLDEIRQA